MNIKFNNGTAIYLHGKDTTGEHNLTIGCNSCTEEKTNEVWSNIYIFPSAINSSSTAHIVETSR